MGAINSKRLSNCNYDYYDLAPIIATLIYLGAPAGRAMLPSFYKILIIQVATPTVAVLTVLLRPSMVMSTWQLTLWSRPQCLVVVVAVVRLMMV
ncbi:hypothetical protein [Lactobacillus xylocopicola]|uniref:hypothetical protein n=1 Tax=Lactobacillus xylocopicola TaxID=2976676 RepID=UPI0029536345|nr:hypothetical protein [Lactobacillus xylocopicola]